MKNYQANEELTNILLSNGFQDLSSKEFKLKGKKSFKISKTSRKEIRFNYINIEVIDPYSIMTSRITIDENELKALLFYFKLKSQQFKTFAYDGIFDFDKIIGQINNKREQLVTLEKFKAQQSTLNKLKRLFEIYDSITIN